MFKAIKEFFTGKPAPVETPAPVAEYKVEAPTIVAVGEPPATVVVEGAGAVEVPAAPVKEKAAKKPAAKKPATAKKPRKPKAPK
jgi:hypothetical protein